MDFDLWMPQIYEKNVYLLKNTTQTWHFFKMEGLR